jgi:transcriptional regulator with XRE-family HTH domain
VGRIRAFNNIDTFGERLKFVRLFFQLTQIDLADLIDVQQGTLTKIERNVFLPEQNVIKKISDIFSLNPLYLRHGQAPIFTRELVFGDFFVTDRNRKLQNLLSGEAIEKIVLFLLNTEQVQEVYGISGKSVYDIFIFASSLNYPHYLAFRSDIEAGTSIRRILHQQNLRTFHVEDSNLLGVFDALYYGGYQFPCYKNFRDALRKIDIPENLQFLLGFSEGQVLSPLTIVREDALKAKELLEFFLAKEADERQIQAAMKLLKKMKKTSVETDDNFN